MKSNTIFVSLLLLLSLTIYPQDFQITIDAEKDAFYNTLTGPNNGWIWIPPEAFNNNGPQPVADWDLSANWYSAWDPTYLYVYVEVNDDIVSQDQGTNYWANDCFDAKVDPDFNAAASNEVFCFAMTVMDSADVDPSLYGGIGNIVETVGGGWVQNGDSTAIKSVTKDDYARKVKATEDGYVLECRLKWEWIVTGTKGPIVPDVGLDIGFAVSISDNDLTAGREKSIQWGAQLLDAVWSNCTYMGHIKLLADNKIEYVPESLRDPSIVNPNPNMYIPSGVGVSDETAVVKNFALSQNYPNPFNPATQIKYSIPQSGYITLKVFNLLGQEVTTLFEGFQQMGNYTATFDGSGLASGVYIYRLTTENPESGLPAGKAGSGQVFTDTKKIMLIK